MTNLFQLARERWRRFFSLPDDDLLRQPAYRRLWSSILISSFGGQVTMLALPLTAAVLLHASPSQMGVLTAMEILPFVLLSLPSGVWLDRVRKLPVYIVGEATIGVAVLTVPLAWWAGWLSMGWMYAVALLLGCVYTTAGSAAQIVLTQVVARERLIEAHAKNALAGSAAEVMGPGLAGVLIKLVGAPLALIADACMLVASVAILRGVHVHEVRTPRKDAHFLRDLKAGVRFVAGQRLLLPLAAAVGGWQLCHQAAIVVQILFATRELGLSAGQVGLSYVAQGAGSVLAGWLGHRVSSRLGPGPALVLGFAICGVGWAVLAAVPAGPWGVAAFAFMLVCFGVGATFIFINFLSMRQAVTPEPLLGRMTSTMRWLILIPAGPGALLGGYLGEHFGLRASLTFAGGTCLLLALVAWRAAVIRGVRELPKPESHDELVGAEAAVGGMPRDVEADPGASAASGAVPAMPATTSSATPKAKPVSPTSPAQA